MSIVEAPCAQIRIGERHRRDLGDLKGLAASIEKDGLYQPVGITPDYQLVFGERRFRAICDELGWPTVPARIVDVPSIVVGEYTENEMRKDFTASERVAIVEALKSFEHGGDRRSDQAANWRLDGVTTDDAARKAGFDSERTYQRARQVVENAVDEVIAEMDADHLSVSAAAVISAQPPDRQREIIRLPPPKLQEAVRKLRRKDLPTAAEAHRKAKNTGKAILDRNLQWQTPMPMEQRRPLIERNHAVMAVVDGARAIALVTLSAAEIAAGIREFDTPDVDLAGQCRKAMVLLQRIDKELNPDANH
jgi:ParB-like chromosome segregation protein Spo0J